MFHKGLWYDIIGILHGLLNSIIKYGVKYGKAPHGNTGLIYLC